MAHIQLSHLNCSLFNKQFHNSHFFTLTSLSDASAGLVRFANNNNCFFSYKTLVKSETQRMFFVHTCWDICCECVCVCVRVCVCVGVCVCVYLFFRLLVLQSNKYFVQCGRGEGGRPRIAS